MPKLPKDIQKSAEAAELSGGFEALEPGTYLCRVREIDVTSKTKAGEPKWVFQYDVIDGPEELDPEDRVSRGRLFEHAALSEKAAWKMKQIFTCLGYTLDSDSDELVGEALRVVVTQQEIQEGNRKGTMGNNIVSYLEADPKDARLTA